MPGVGDGVGVGIEQQRIEQKKKSQIKMLTNAHNWQFVKLSEINELAAKRLSRATKSGRARGQCW